MSRPLTSTRGTLIAAAQAAVDYLTRLVGPHPSRTARTVLGDLTHALDQARPPMPMTPEDVKRIRGGLGVTQAELAEQLGVSHTAVAHWEQGRRRPSATAQRLLRRIAEETQDQGS